MKTSSILVSFILITSLLSCGTTKEKETIHIEEGKVGMIGYGSLISFNSMKYTLGRDYVDSTYLVHLEGFHRDWNYVCSYKDSLLPEDIFDYNSFYIRNQDTIRFENAVFLNIVADVESSINCVLYIISEEELEGFDQRELGY